MPADPGCTLSALLRVANTVATLADPDASDASAKARYLDYVDARVSIVRGCTRLALWAYEAFHATAGGLLQGLFRDRGLQAGDAELAADAMMAVIEGIHLHDRDRDPDARNELVLWTLHRLSGQLAGELHLD